jgi:hypothetical protein
MGMCHFADHSANRIEMLGIHLDPRAPGKLDHNPG